MKITINVFTNHKFGSSWLFSLLKDFSKLNDLKFYSTNRGWKGYHESELNDKACVLYRNATYEVVSKVCQSGARIIRDPRAVLCSAYFSHLNTHSVEDWRQLDQQRKLLKRFDEQTGFRLTLAFLERSVFFHGTVGPLNALSTWIFDDPRYTVFRVEDFFMDPKKYLSRTIVANGLDPNHFNFPDSEKYSFKNLTGRAIGEINANSHYRSGNPDEWKEYLPDDVVAYLTVHYKKIIEDYYDE